MRNIVVKSLGTLAFVCAMLGASARDLYVNPSGDNANDGLAAIADGAGAGPKKTLAAAMAIAENGDVVHAAAGTYSEGEVTTSEKYGSYYVTVTNRCIIPEGVTLLGAGVGSTFITGRQFGSAATTWKNNTATIRCVVMNKNSKLIGVTVTGGSAPYYDATVTGSAVDGEGGGIKALGGGCLFQDCVITNNFGRQGGAFYLGGTGDVFLRCRIASNYSGYIASGIRGGGYTAVNCYFYGGNSYLVYPGSQTTKFVNCTFSGQQPLRNKSGGHLYNCVLSGVTSWNTEDVSSFHNCRFGEQGIYDSASTKSHFDPDTVVGTDLTDAGSNTYYYANFPAAYLADEAAKDYSGKQRIYNGSIDIGQTEHDWRGDFAADLSGSRPDVALSVASASSNVCETAAKTLALADGAELVVDWASPEAGESKYYFNAAIDGAGTLRCYMNGAAEPAATVAGDGTSETVTLTSSAESVCLRFVYEGDGAATLSDFMNHMRVSITASDGGLVLTGISAGDTEVSPESPVTFTVARGWDSTHLCTGFLVNGSEFVSFDDYPNGWTHTAFSPATCVSIEAQYLSSNDWYVDSVGGRDTNSGFLPENAKRTIADVITNTAVKAGETIWLMPGSHKDGVMANGNDKTLNRAILPAGVNLASTSGRADDTLVIGAAAPVENRIDGCGGCGVGSVRCLKLLGESCVSNITFCGGTVACDGYKGADTLNESYGGVAGAGVQDSVRPHLFGCVISNCQANINAAVGKADLFRCRVSDNKAYNYSSGAEYCYLYNCVVQGNVGVYAVHYPRRIVNSTIIAVAGYDSIRTTATQDYSVYNSIVTYNGTPQAMGLRFFRCHFGGTRAISKSDVLEWGEGCDNGVSYDADTLAPTKPGSGELDGGNDAYLAQIPAKFAAERYLDFYGNPRELGGSVDIGAVEYDWRKDFAADLGRGMSVSAASSNVVETAGGSVRVNDAQSLCIVRSGSGEPKSRQFPFSISGGTLTISLNGAPAGTFTSDGAWTWENPSTDDKIEFSFSATEPGGYADLGKAVTLSGFIISFR